MSNQRKDLKIASLVSFFISSLTSLDRAVVGKVAALVLVGGGILLGSSSVIRSKFKDKALDLSEKDLTGGFNSIFSKEEKLKAFEKTALSSDEVRQMALEEELEQDGRYLRRTDSTTLIKKPKGAIGQRGNPKEIKKKQALSASKSGMTRAKPKMKGFGEHPEVGSISGFRMKTAFGGLQKQKKAGAAQHAPSAADDEDSEEGSWQHSQAMAACSKTCATLSRLAVTRESSCVGSDKIWVDDQCVDKKKFESCGETNSVCQ